MTEDNESYGITYVFQFLLEQVVNLLVWGAPYFVWALPCAIVLLLSYLIIVEGVLPALEWTLTRGARVVAWFLRTIAALIRLTGKLIGTLTLNAAANRLELIARWFLYHLDFDLRYMRNNVRYSTQYSGASAYSGFEEAFFEDEDTYEEAKRKQYRESKASANESRSESGQKSTSEAKVVEKTPYEIIGVSKSDSVEKMKEAYKKLIKLNHPDKTSTLDPALQELAQMRTKEINAAFDIIRANHNF